ncbi:Retrovirus-related Pol polyprotein from transposon 17.6 [Trichinella papuae]|uniref:Retrovirus-related Pol polyprotein from transposon 17.6 n=1 Tax=Trichinella papuae TaxID=268474 RepID=A0A0V1N4E4_9BILA|nr:Retrovirus-related Pol polyprotein from transposon 17.6 [Trichinella papuae]
MPFELCNAPVTFRRFMETSLRGLVGSKCLVYLNDVIVFGKTAEEHTARLRKIPQGSRPGSETRNVPVDEGKGSVIRPHYS